MGVDAKCHGNAGLCRGNVWVNVQSASGMQGNSRECQGNVWEREKSARGIR